MTNHDTHSAQSWETLGEFSPDWIVTPGEIIGDVLAERGWTKTEFAQRTEFSEKHIHQLLNGTRSITQDTAIKLEKVLGSTPRFWLGLEAQYREQLAKTADMAELAADVDWLKELPLSDMIRFGWVQRAASRPLQVYNCLRYFAVSSVTAWRLQYQQPVAAYRASGLLTKSPATVSTWLRQAEKLADALRCAPYDKSRFETTLTQARALTCESSSAVFFPQLQQLCAVAGVAVVLAPAPKGCPVSGATKWLTPQKALVVLSLRGKSDDKFWFTFFHEAAHLLKHGKSLTFLDILGKDGLNAAEEAEADAFARNFLLPQDAYKAFVAQARFSQASVCSFAEQQQTSPGIVVGRLQFDKRLPWTHLNGLKAMYSWDLESLA